MRQSNTVQDRYMEIITINGIKLTVWSKSKFIKDSYLTQGNLLDLIQQFLKVVRKNLSTCTFEINTKYNRNDVRRFLTEDQRKTLSRLISRCNGYRMFSSKEYKEFCRTIGEMIIHENV